MKNLFLLLTKKLKAIPPSIYFGTLINSSFIVFFFYFFFFFVLSFSNRLAFRLKGSLAPKKMAKMVEIVSASMVQWLNSLEKLFRSKFHWLILKEGQCNTVSISMRGGRKWETSTTNTATSASKNSFHDIKFDRRAPESCYFVLI